METADINVTLIEGYLSLLKNLSHNNKLELIARLSNSMKTTKMSKEVSLQSLYGSWVDEKSADDLVSEIRNARNFTRKREEL